MALAYERAFDRANQQEHEAVTRRGAQRLVETIKNYWADRGFEIDIYAVEKPFVQEVRAQRWDIISDLVDGLPKKTCPAIK